jgi:hypothetical protein
MDFKRVDGIKRGVANRSRINEDKTRHRVTRSGSAVAKSLASFQLVDPLNVIAGRQDLSAFFIRHWNIGHETFYQRRLPHLFLGPEGTSNLMLAFKKRIHGPSP